MDTTLRYRFYQLLEMRDQTSRLAFFVNTFIMLLIVVNVIAVILESVSSYQRAFGPWFWYVEIFSIAVFTVEYIARLWCSAENLAYGSGWRGRLHYMLTPMALIDLVAILPFYLRAFTSMDARILRILRLLRVFKLSRHFAVLGILGTVLRNEAKTLLSAIFVMLILVILSASGIYVVERNIQPDAFGSIPSAMWWATVILTTVGYGDVVPMTVAGRLLGVFITVLGVGMAALPAGIIASGFTAELARRRERYEMTAKKLLMVCDINSNDRTHLAEKREELGLAADDARL
ncbi:MAG: ion transporter [Gammaproteobacteria bacterium]|nr:ion transporter [Gammaproteobacteria bacterium]